MRTLLCALLLAGCGGGGSGESTSRSGWAAAVALPSAGGSADGVVGTNLAVLSTGRRIVLYPIRWEGNAANPYDCYQAVSDDGGATWNAAPFAPDSEARSANMAVDAQDRLHVAYSNLQDILYTSSVDGGVTWTTPEVISHTPRYGNIVPLISVDRLLRVHVMYHDGNADDDSQPCEAWYVRLDLGTPVMLSADDGKHSAFPRADFTGVDDGTLAIVWRDERNTTWDIYGAFSTDGGTTWTERAVRTGAQNQWDPMAIVDRHGVVHVSIMTPDGDAIEDRIEYATSPDAGLAWSSWSMISDDVRTRFPFFAYDYAGDVVWLFFKDERDWEGGDAKADLAGRSLSGGVWSDLEFLTDYGDLDVRFPAFAVSADGQVHAIYSVGGDEIFTVYYTMRLAP